MKKVNDDWYDDLSKEEKRAIDKGLNDLKKAKHTPVKMSENQSVKELKTNHNENYLV